MKFYIRLSIFNLLLFFHPFLDLQNILAQQTSLDFNPADSVYVADERIQMHSLLQNTAVYVDSSNRLTIEDLATEKFSNRFSPLSGFIQPAEPYITYWLKFSITVSGHIDNWWLLLDGVPGVDTIFDQHGYVDVYFLDTLYTIISHQRTGLFVPRSEKTITQNPGLSRVLISLDKRETKNVFIRIYNEYGSASIKAPQLRNPLVGIRDQKIEVLSVFLGAVILFSLLSFFFFFFVGERAYLFFGIYTLILSLSYLALHPDHPLINIFFPEYPQLILPAFILLTQGGFIVFILFGRYFINLQELSKKLDTILKWFLAAWAVNLIITIITMIVTHKNIPVETSHIFIGLFFVFLIRIAFLKSILVRFYVAGALWLVCFSIIGLLRNRLFVTVPFDPWPVAQGGQLFIYIAGLAYKMRLNEQARAQAEVVKLRNVELANLYDESTKQKKEIELQKKNIEDALIDLKNTQSQLIQSEKMASLGELTAGIAHEIQNPLNFVNNFSEVNKELLAEMKDELDQGHLEEAKIIATDVIGNQEKINHHGKRAEAIVKGMLMHSRSSSGVLEPTDINALADEYLRLAYHGLRAKDKSFNATMKTDYDESIGFINIVPQEIGRVILNLITNAFYAVSTAPKSPILRPAGTQPDASSQQPGDLAFEPTVTVTTKLLKSPVAELSHKGEGKQVEALGDLGANGERVEIRVKDNGSGIPKNILNKIFQPFFTTKASGQGTGLGLSLSYDIVKAHGGELKVETKEGEGSEFIIQLPIV